MNTPVARSTREHDVTRILAGVAPTTQSPRTLVVLCGLPGVGKSHLAARLSAQTQAPVLESDAVRALLFKERRYTRSEHRRVFDALHAAADALLAQGSSAIVDATNLTERDRTPLYAIADRHGARLITILVTAPDETARERIQLRAMEASNSEAGAETYEAMQWRLEGIRRAHRVIDTSGDIGPALTTLAKEMMQQ